jgi:hypothetical protein
MEESHTSAEHAARLVRVYRLLYNIGVQAEGLPIPAAQNPDLTGMQPGKGGEETAEDEGPGVQV